ncbi:MAG: hypothetical protein AMXMBFR22_32930 [Phycisphaerae bacterium]
MREHHVFLGDGASKAFFYAGAAHLGSYGADHTADFELEHALPRPVWLRFGGYAGWRLELEHEHVDLAPGDESSLAAQLATFAAQAFSHVSLTRYEEDSLHVFKNERCAWLMYLREPSDGGLYLSRKVATGNARPEHFRCDCGIDLEADAEQTITVPEALDVVRLFFRRGALPSDYEWTEEC